MNENKLTPSIRFKNNDGENYPEWDFVKVKEIASINTGNKDTKDAVENGQYDFYVRSPIVHKIDSFSYDGEAVLTVGDGVGVGKVFHYVNGKFDFHQRVYKISDFKDYYGLLFYYYFQKNFLKEAQKYNAKTSVDSVRKSMIADMYVPKIEMSEQIKIGNFFSKLDRQIELEEQKLKKLEEQKKGYMQKIFSQELQFRDKITNNFDNWSEFKIKDIFSKIESGNRLPKNNLLDGDIPYVIAQTTNNGVYMNISKDTLDYHGNNLKKFKKGSITISIDNPDAMFIQAHDFVTSNVMRVLYNENLSIEAHTFILYSLRKLTQTYNWSVKFSGPIIMDSKIKLPVKLNTNDIDWDIVNKIGEFLNKLDFKIYQNTTKVELLRQRKHGLLQKMFV